MQRLSDAAAVRAPRLPLSSNGCAAALRQSKCPGDAQACAPTAKGLPICGRFTVKATWAEIVALYRLALDRPPHNLQPRYNLVPPTY
jgi:hypothetical protein